MKKNIILAILILAMGSSVEAAEELHTTKNKLVKQTPVSLFSNHLHRCFRPLNTTAIYIESATITVSLNRDAYVENVDIIIKERKQNRDDSERFIENFRNYVISAVKHCEKYNTLSSFEYDQWKVIVNTYEFQLTEY